MKKVLVLLICLLLVGCNKDEEKSFISQFDDTYYQVYEPYVKAIGNYSLESYDKETVENGLMNLSMQYFKTNNSYYQEGQYLAKDDLIYLLSQDVLNKNDNKYNYIKAILEQNYVSSNGTLKGVSLAIVLDQIQYTKVDGKTKKVVIKENDLIKHTQMVVNELVKFVRDKIGDERIMIAVFLDDVFIYSGITSDDKIELKKLNYHYESLDNNYVIKNDTKNYNQYLVLYDKVSDYNTYISTKAFYDGNTLNNLTIDINTSYLTKPQLLNLASTVSKNIDFSSYTKVYIKNNNQIKAFLIKEANTLEVKIYLMED